MTHPKPVTTAHGALKEVYWSQKTDQSIPLTLEYTRSYASSQVKTYYCQLYTNVYRVKQLCVLASVPGPTTCLLHVRCSLIPYNCTMSYVVDLTRPYLSQQPSSPHSSSPPPPPSPSSWWSHALPSAVKVGHKHYHYIPRWTTSIGARPSHVQGLVPILIHRRWEEAMNI